MIDGQRPKKLSGPKLWSPNEVSVVYYGPERSGRFCNQMMFMNDRFIRSFCVVWLIVAGVLVAGNSGLAAPVGDLDETHPAVRAVISVQDEVTPALLRQPMLRLRALLCAAFLRPERAPAVPPAGAVSFAPDPEVPPAIYTALGFPLFGGRAIRADVVEAAARRLHGRPSPRELASRLACHPGDVPRIRRALDVASGDRDLSETVRPTLSTDIRAGSS